MKPVVTNDTHRDITQIVRAEGANHNFDPIGFIAGAIAESNLSERASREGQWPDVSYGLWQPAVAWLGAEVPGLTRNFNGVVADTQANRDLARAFCFDAANLAGYVAPRYAGLLHQYGDPVEAWCRWNSPSVPGSQNPHRPAYVNAFDQAQQFHDDPTLAIAAPLAMPAIDFIGAHPTNFDVGRGGVAPEAIVLHIAEGPLGAVDSFFNQDHAPQGQGPSSAHFCVGKAGEIHQYVHTGDRAFGNGIIEPGFTAELINDNPGINPNRFTISIEHEGMHGDAVPAPQFATSTRLTAWLFQARLFNSGATGVAVDRKHILRHADISPNSKALCPSWDEPFIANYIAAVKALLGIV